MGRFFPASPMDFQTPPTIPAAPSIILDVAHTLSAIFQTLDCFNSSPPSTCGGSPRLTPIPTFVVSSNPMAPCLSRRFPDTHSWTRRLTLPASPLLTPVPVWRRYPSSASDPAAASFNSKPFLVYFPMNCFPLHGGSSHDLSRIKPRPLPVIVGLSADLQIHPCLSLCDSLQRAS